MKHHKQRPSSPPSAPLDRRRFVAYFSGLGLSSTLFPGVLWSETAGTADRKVTVDLIEKAEELAGLAFTPEERAMMAEGLEQERERFEAVRGVALDNAVPPALRFTPLLPGMQPETRQRRIKWSRPPRLERPGVLEDLAFWPVTHLAALVKARKVTPVELTEMYLARLKRYDPALKCVVTLTEDLARSQARRADKEIAAGGYRGPLHGIPWGAKDLLATKGYRTTWGAMPYKDQVIDLDAAVVERLDAAGAVLVAKLTLGALAMGDVWFGGRTMNPWNTEKGSSGSSAGPGAATAAGLVGFSIGTETHGSIISPSMTCGVTGLRPTFGRVSRYGAMALSWSMDKIGPMCRSVEDCAMVLEAIRGPDAKDGFVIDAAFNWDAALDVTKLRVGYLEEAYSEEQLTKFHGQATLDTLRGLGIELIPVKLPEYPVDALGYVLFVEAAAAFDELTRSNRDDLLVRQKQGAWPNIFRKARMVPAVEYVQAMRVRTLVMEAMARLFEEIDVYVAPPWGKAKSILTNLTGHPLVVLPNGFTEEELPTCTTFVGNLFGEAELLAVAKAYQDATEHHLKHPALEG